MKRHHLHLDTPTVNGGKSFIFRIPCSPQTLSFAASLSHIKILESASDYGSYRIISLRSARSRLPTLWNYRRWRILNTGISCPRNSSIAEMTCQRKPSFESYCIKKLTEVTSNPL
ncbi:hypothetical protein ABKN59_005015 [Abortiporus biennis]